LLDLLRQRARLLIQTQVVEDCIGTEKNTQFSTAQKNFKKNLRPQWLQLFEPKF
jgi:hypothetical protein